jgi:predicted nuclease with TOPRIM domain
MTNDELRIAVAVEIGWAYEDQKAELQKLREENERLKEQLKDFSDEDTECRKLLAAWDKSDSVIGTVMLADVIRECLKLQPIILHDDLLGKNSP